MLAWFIISFIPFFSEYIAIIFKNSELSTNMLFFLNPGFFQCHSVHLRTATRVLFWDNSLYVSLINTCKRLTYSTKPFLYTNLNVSLILFVLSMWTVQLQALVALSRCSRKTKIMMLILFYFEFFLLNQLSLIFLCDVFMMSFMKK